MIDKDIEINFSVEQKSWNNFWRYEKNRRKIGSTQRVTVLWRNRGETLIQSLMFQSKTVF